MIDLKLQIPMAEEIEVDANSLAAIDRGIKAANEGEAVPLDEVREMIPKWISKFESHHRRQVAYASDSVSDVKVWMGHHS